VRRLKCIIETERLIIRNVAEYDAEALLKIDCDEQVKKYYPTFDGENDDADAHMEHVMDIIEYYHEVAEESLLFDEKHPVHTFLSAVCLKDTGEVIGKLGFDRHGLINEWGLSWCFLSGHTRKGYATEAVMAAADYYLGIFLSLDYLWASIREDNIASFKVAQKSGYKLIEKRLEFKADITDYHDIGEYFNGLNSAVDFGWYYFQKVRKQ